MRREEAEKLAADARRARAEAAGAPKVLARIDRLLKQKDFRVIDLLSSSGFDASGDGLLDAAELQTSLRTVGLKLTRKEAHALVDFLDASGDGSVDAKELEDALRQHRRDFNPDGSANVGEHVRASQLHRPSVAAKHAAILKARAKAERERKAAEVPPNDGYDPIALCFDHSWLGSLDTFLGKHTGPQDEHSKHMRFRQAMEAHKARGGAASPGGRAGGDLL